MRLCPAKKNEARVQSREEDESSQKHCLCYDEEEEEKIGAQIKRYIEERITFP